MRGSQIAIIAGSNKKMTRTAASAPDARHFKIVATSLSEIIRDIENGAIIRIRPEVRMEWVAPL